MFQQFWPYIEGQWGPTTLDPIDYRCMYKKTLLFFKSQTGLEQHEGEKMKTELHF